jgi:hypothetical protein
MQLSEQSSNINAFIFIFLKSKNAPITFRNKSVVL